MSNIDELEQVAKALNNIAFALIISSQWSGRTEKDVALKALEENLNG